MSEIYSLSNPPSAPTKKAEKNFQVEKIQPLFLPKTPVSISKPPPAPRKQYRRIKPKPYPILSPPLLQDEEREATPVSMFREVRSKFLLYDADSVASISDTDLLKDIYRWYNPPSCPRTVTEGVYLKLVSDAAEARLKSLGSDLY